MIASSRTARRTLGVLVAALAALPRPAIAQQPSAPDPLVEKFLARTEPPVISYRALRHMEASNARFDLRGWADVMTELSPETGFKFEVLREGGSRYIRNRVIRAVLKGEQKMIADGDPDRAALTLDNYVLRASSASASEGLAAIVVRPRHKDVLLVDGTIFVSERDVDLVRIEGQLAKGPSFWTPEVHVDRRYGRIAGMRVAVSIESTSKVRIAGPSMMTVTYEYQSINGQPVPSSTSDTAR